MSDPTPNTAQRELIAATDGIHVVDAGAGTGKTFTVTRRYANIVDDPPTARTGGESTGATGDESTETTGDESTGATGDESTETTGGESSATPDGDSAVTPEDVLLVTFTDNAATEMKERIVASSGYGMRELRDAPIQTFHSLCHDVLLEHGFDAPRHLGIDDHVTAATRILDDETVEAPRFREFLRRFADDHPEYDDAFRVVDDPLELLGLVKELAAKGVFPTQEGWYRDGERHLDGDFAAFRELFDDANEPRNDGRKQSRLRSRLGGYGRDKCYHPDAPSRMDVRGEGTKQVPESIASEAFHEDREALKAFVHDVYHEYLAFALGRNYLNFAFLQLLAYVLLCEDHALRDSIAFEYVMVDEFQDTSEIQFKLATLLAATNNLCVVGDWKQSIYGFQYAAVENIIDFRDRLDAFVDDLNSDHERVSWATRPVRDHRLTENYRSTQAILDLAERSLETPAIGSETVDASDAPAAIESLSSNAVHEHSRIEAFQHAEEHAAVLTKIQRIVETDAPAEEHPYAVETDDGDLRVPEYNDIAVLTRTRDYGRELLDVADAHAVPMAYEGGIELFRTDPAKLLLAWLRILESDADRGWAVVLERAGYTLPEIEHVLDAETYPEEMRSFRERLRERESIGGVARAVFSTYDCDDGTADVVLSTIQSVHDATTFSRGDLVRFIERGIETGSTHEIHASTGLDAVTVQTIHAAKGLEHPIVILANMNRHRFPPSGSNASAITFDDPIGLRQRKRYSTATGHPYVHDDWQSEVLRKCLPRGYDEERRLLYVAMTRAESHLLFGAGDTPNAFLEALPVDVETLEPAITESDARATTQSHLQIAVPTPEGPSGETPHTIMRDDVFDDEGFDRERDRVRERAHEGGTHAAGAGGGAESATDFGQAVHDFAEAYALGEADSSSNDHERNVAAFLDALDGEFHVEQDAVLPLDVDGERVTISGVVDLVAVTDDSVTVVDFKTDASRDARAEYCKQLSVYVHVLASAFDDRAVSAFIYWTGDGDRDRVDPLSLDGLREVVAAARRDD